MHDDNLSQRIHVLEDRVALKKLVDTFSNPADQKDVQEQVLLFTEVATVDSYVGDQLMGTLNGRYQIGDASRCSGICGCARG